MWGVLIDVDVAGTTISGMQLTGMNGDCIRLNGNNDNATIEKNQFTFCGEDGIEALFVVDGSDGILVVNNRFKNIDRNAIAVFGDDAVIEKNRCDTVDNNCVDLTGDNGEVVNNRGENIDEEFIDVNGDNALVDKNRVKNADGGILVEGFNPIIPPSAWT